MNNLAKPIQSFLRVVISTARKIGLITRLFPKTNLLLKWSMILLIGQTSLSLTASIPTINYLEINDTIRIEIDRLTQLLSSSDTLDLGQLDKLEVHLVKNGVEEVHYQMTSIENTSSQTPYPLIRYHHLPEGVHHLNIWSSISRNFFPNCIFFFSFTPYEF